MNPTGSIRRRAPSPQQPAPQPAEPKSWEFPYYIPHLLILFNVWGIPLSFGSWAEYYWNSRLQSSSITQIMSIFCAQLFCLFGFTLLWGKIWHSYSRGLIILGSLMVVTCQMLLSVCQQWWHFTLLHGVGMGTALGMLLTGTTFNLATLYRRRGEYTNFPALSMMLSVIGPVGAIILIVPIRLVHANERGFRQMCCTNASISGVTLGAACYCIRRKFYHLSEPIWLSRPPFTWGNIKSLPAATLCYILGYLCVWVGLYILPAYVVIFTSQLTWPNTGLAILIVSLAFCALGYWMAASPKYQNELGHLNMVCVCAVICSTCYIPLAFNLNVKVIWFCSVTYFYGMGWLHCVFLKLMEVFPWGQGISGSEPMRLGVLLLACGFAAAGGQAMVAAFGHAGMLMTGFLVTGIIMAVGAVLLCVARLLKSGWRFYYVI